MSAACRNATESPLAALFLLCKQIFINIELSGLNDATVNLYSRITPGGADLLFSLTPVSLEASC